MYESGHEVVSLSAYTAALLIMICRFRIAGVPTSGCVGDIQTDNCKRTTAFCVLDAVSAILLDRNTRWTNDVQHVIHCLVVSCIEYWQLRILCYSWHIYTNDKDIQLTALRLTSSIIASIGLSVLHVRCLR